MNIGLKVKKFREQKGMTQKQLGEKIHVTESTIANYEAGRRSPTIDTLKKIAEILTIKMEQFFQEEIVHNNKESIKIKKEKIEMKTQNMESDITKPLYRFIIAEQTLFMRMILKGILEKVIPCEIVEEDTLKEVQQQLKKEKNQKKPFDLIFISSNLPDLNHLEELTHIQKKLPDTNMVVTSSLNIKKQIAEVGLKYLIQKPFNEEELLSVVLKCRTKMLTNFSTKKQYLL